MATIPKPDRTVEKLKAMHYAVKGYGEAGLHVKDVDSVGRVVTGFYNTYNFFDSDGDVLLMGAAKKSIKERGPKSTAIAKVKHALFHDLTKLPGKVLELEEREIDGMKGIYFATRMADTTIGNDTLKNYLEGIYDNHSIGFRYIDVEYIDPDAKSWKKYRDELINPEDADKQGFMFVVKEIALYEGSTVAFGANQLTPYLGVKSGNKESLKLALFDRINKLQKTLVKGTQSDEQMHLFELQTMQLKQMIEELTNTMPAKLITSPTTPVKGATQSKVNYKQLNETFKL